MSRPSGSGFALWCGLILVLSSMLVTLVQPLLARQALAWFGGSPEVWATSFLFFQAALLAGCVYAHVLSRLLAPSWQVAVHALLSGASLVLNRYLSTYAPHTWQPSEQAMPVVHILSTLIVQAGLPLVVLWGTLPLVQSWQGYVEVGRPSFRWQALAGAGAAVAILLYLLVVEPSLPLVSQWRWWNAGFSLFALAVSLLLIVLRNVATDPLIRALDVEPDLVLGEEQAELRWWQPAAWIALPAFASVLLLAVTNHLGQEVPAAPFVWLLPLGVYCVSLFLAFDGEFWYSRRWYGLGLLASALAVSSNMAAKDPPPNLIAETLALLILLFFSLMVCHGELARLRPTFSRTTLFYTLTAAGSVLGCLFVVFVGPLVFTRYLELSLGLLFAFMLGATVLAYDPRLYGEGYGSGRRAIVLVAAVIGLLVTARFQFDSIRESLNVVAARRGFYGTTRVELQTSDDVRQQGKTLYVGDIRRGFQYTHPDYQTTPTLHHARQSGIGLAWAALGAGPKRVGIVGLGAGTLAAYGNEGDQLWFYEINPDVIEFAETEFTFLDNCLAEKEIVRGDPRLNLEKESNQGFDLLVLDVLQTESIPVHLLTSQAFKTYLKHLQPDGVLAVNFDTTHTDLMPVVAALAREHDDLELAVVAKREHHQSPDQPSLWMLVSRNHTLIRRCKSQSDQAVTNIRQVPAWTDDYSDVARLLQ